MHPHSQILALLVSRKHALSPRRARYTFKLPRFLPRNSHALSTSLIIFTRLRVNITVLQSSHAETVVTFSSPRSFPLLHTSVPIIRHYNRRSATHFLYYRDCIHPRIRRDTNLAFLSLGLKESSSTRTRNFVSSQRYSSTYPYSHTFLTSHLPALVPLYISVFCASELLCINAFALLRCRFFTIERPHIDCLISPPFHTTTRLLVSTSAQLRIPDSFPPNIHAFASQSPQNFGSTQFYSHTYRRSRAIVSPTLHSSLSLFDFVHPPQCLPTFVPSNLPIFTFLNLSAFRSLHLNLFKPLNFPALQAPLFSAVKPQCLTTFKTPRGLASACSCSIALIPKTLREFVHPPLRDSTLMFFCTGAISNLCDPSLLNSQSPQNAPHCIS